MAFDISKIKLIVGLGNLGAKYSNTRHNAGFIFMDALAKHIAPDQSWKLHKDLSAEILKLKQCYLAKPTTMMNASGKAVVAIMNYFKEEEIMPENILVVHDDLDVPLGNYKIQFSKGPSVHNGISSVQKHLGTPDFWRLRLGIENREVKGNKGVPGETYTLQRFTKEELVDFHQLLFDLINQNLFN
jgi:PTH1 family peptidyl-tRNA hydrolase